MHLDIENVTQVIRANGGAASCMEVLSPEGDRVLGYLVFCVPEAREEAAAFAARIDGEARARHKAEMVTFPASRAWRVGLVAPDPTPAPAPQGEGGLNG